MDFETWLDELIRPDSRKNASKKAGYAQSTLSRQLEKGKLSPEMVIALCRGYGKSPVTGLIETGYLNEWETEGVGIPYALQKATNQQILDEILKRSDPEARLLFTNDADPNVIDLVDEQPGFTPRVISDSELDEALQDVRQGQMAAKTRDPHRYEEPETP